MIRILYFASLRERLGSAEETLQDFPATLAGLRTNIRVGIAYMKGWNEEIGCVAWDDLMEDLATLEISRAQTWQWLHHGVALDDEETVTQDLVVRIFRDEMAKIADEIREAMTGFPDEAIAAETQRFQEAQHTACAIFTEPEFRPFLKMSSDLVKG